MDPEETPLSLPEGTNLLSILGTDAGAPTHLECSQDVETLIADDCCSIQIEFAIF
jgi:hypothetical protein